MKGTLTFTLPDEHTEWVAANNAGDYAAALHEIRELVRGQVKHGPSKTLEELYREICEICSDAELP